MGRLPAGPVQALERNLGESDPAGAEARVIHRVTGWIRESIARRLAAWFLLISFVPCAVLALVTYLLSSGSLENTIHRTLLMAAQNKSRQIEAYAVERIRSVTALSRTRSFVNATGE